ncbi:MAG: helix-turn-helix domain-containing protein [Moorellales bacterium]
MPVLFCPRGWCLTERLAYRPKEVAELTGLSLRTVYNLISEGQLPHRKVRGREGTREAVLIPARALEAWLAGEWQPVKKRRKSNGHRV